MGLNISLDLSSPNLGVHFWHRQEHKETQPRGLSRRTDLTGTSRGDFQGKFPRGLQGILYSWGPRDQELKRESEGERFNKRRHDKI